MPVLLALTNASLADDYPSKPIRLVIPFAAGSATDSAGRILAQALSQRLGQGVIVDNRPGANGQSRPRSPRKAPRMATRCS